MPVILVSDSEDDEMETAETAPSRVVHSPFHDSTLPSVDSITCSSGWKRMLKEADLYRDITDTGYYTLSSCTPGYGITDLLHDSQDRWWKTNHNLPHRIVVEFQKKTDICYLMVYVDFKLDESFCPQEFEVKLGMSRNDLFFEKRRTFFKPQGWIKLDLRSNEPRRPHRVMTLILTILGNHEGGRDCHIRHFRVIGPSIPQYDPIQRLQLGMLPSFNSIDIVGDPEKDKIIKSVLMRQINNLR